MVYQQKGYIIESLRIVFRFCVMNCKNKIRCNYDINEYDYRKYCYKAKWVDISWNKIQKMRRDLYLIYKKCFIRPINHKEIDIFNETENHKKHYYYIKNRQNTYYKLEKTRGKLYLIISFDGHKWYCTKNALMTVIKYLSNDNIKNTFKHLDRINRQFLHTWNVENY